MDIVDSLRIMRRHNDLEGIIDTFNKYKDTEYFTNYPVGDVIRMSYVFYLVYTKAPMDEIEPLIKKELESIQFDIDKKEDYKSLPLTHYHLLNLYAVVLKDDGQICKALSILEIKHEHLLTSRNYNLFGEIYIIVTVNIIYFLHIAKEKLLTECLDNHKGIDNFSLLTELELFQLKENSYERLPLTYVGLFNHYIEDERTKALDYLRKANVVAEIQNNKMYLNIIHHTCLKFQLDL